MSEPIAITRDEARALTRRINSAASDLCLLMLEAYDRQAWRALGYDNWRSYATAELKVSQGHAYRILDQGKVTRALADAVSPNGEIPVVVSEAETRDVKKVLPEVVADVKERLSDGGDPATAVKEAVTEARKARKEAVQEPEHEPPPEGVSEEDGDPDPYEEIESLLHENRRLSELLEQVTESDSDAELAKWSERYARLEGRVSQLTQTAKQAENTAKYATGMLRKVRSALGVERDRDILPAIEALGS